MQRHPLHLAVAFLCGIAVMAPFSIPFIRPALAAVMLTPQQISDKTVDLETRLGTAEKVLARLANAPSDQVQALQVKVDALQSRIDALEKFRNSQGPINDGNATALKSLQNSVNGIGDLINFAAADSGKTKTALALLTKAYNGHTHSGNYANTFSVGSIDCTATLGSYVSGTGAATQAFLNSSRFCIPSASGANWNFAVAGPFTTGPPSQTSP